MIIPNKQTDRLIERLPLEIWTSHAKKHAALVAPYTDAFLKRRSSQKSHPIHDFLFTYYSFSPSKLKQWIPSIHTELETTPQIGEHFPWLNDYWFLLKENILSLNFERIPNHIRDLTQFIAELCSQILQRAPRFGCFGLHEWAMVYRSSPDEIRHKAYRLRLSSQEIAEFVESQVLCCSHYDAYRFFTKEARPLNTLNPSLETRLQMEQGGCVHTNMDLYKWSSKLWPWIGSDLIAKTFFLALEARELDMRASPYDLLDEGYLPLCIETEEGRKLYQKEQQQLTIRSTELRKELLRACFQIQAASGIV